LKIQQTYIFIFILQAFISITSLIAIIWSLALSADFIPFMVLLILSVFFSVSIYISTSNNKLNVDKSTCLISIFVTWFLLIIMGAVPFYIMFPEKNIEDLIFLSLSLASTFGLWLQYPIFFTHEFIIWQSLLQWLGGLITILVASFLVEFILTKSKQNIEYFNLENLKIIVLFYIMITFIFSLIFYSYDKYSIDQSLRLSMALISTSNSFNLDGSVLINENFSFKIFMILAMIFGSLSISMHYKSFNYGVLSYFKNPNFISVVLCSLLVVLVISIFASNETKIPIITMFVDTLFLVISFVTTTGLIPQSLYNYGFLYNFLIFLVIFTLIGGAVNSTTGGLKASRVIFILKFLYRELYKLANPMVVISKENLNLDDNTSRIFIFCISFLFSVLLLSLLLSLNNINFDESFFIIVGSITNSGIGITSIAEINYYPESFLEKIIIFIALLFGRIEVFFIMLFSSSYFWKNK